MVTEFLSWPDGAGLNVIQFLFIFVGAFAGVRITEDIRAWRAAKARRAVDSHGG